MMDMNVIEIIGKYWGYIGLGHFYKIVLLSEVAALETRMMALGSLEELDLNDIDPSPNLVGILSISFHSVLQK